VLGTSRAALRSETRQSAAVPVQSSEQLRLPESAFPNGSVVKQDFAQTALVADGSVFSGLHVSSYTSLGMLGGWLQYYTTPIPDGLFDVAYFGSYYPSASAAGQAFTDVASNPQLSHGTYCSTGDQCFEDAIGVEFPDGEYRGLVLVVQRSNALAEIISVVPAADFDSMQGEIQGNVDRVAGAFLTTVQPAVPTPSPSPTATSTPAPPTATPTNTPTNTPTSTPTPIPVDFTILSVRVEKNGASADTRLLKTPLHRVRAGTRVYLSVYVLVRSAPPEAPAVYGLRVTAHGKDVLHRTFQHELDPSGIGQVYRQHVTFTPTRPGTYRETWQITVQGQTKTGSATFLATK
jgi:hypothetical protein